MSLSLLMAFVSLLFMSVLFLFLVPVAPATLENTMEISGKVKAIQEGEGHDVIIKLSNDPHHYDINRDWKEGCNLKIYKKNWKERKSVYAM